MFRPKETMAESVRNRTARLAGAFARDSTLVSAHPILLRRIMHTMRFTVYGRRILDQK